MERTALRTGRRRAAQENRCDFIGLNYYRRETVSATPQDGPGVGESGVDGLFYFVRNPQSTYTEWGWEIWPQGLTDGIMMIKSVTAISQSISPKMVWGERSDY